LFQIIFFHLRKTLTLRIRKAGLPLIAMVLECDAYHGGLFWGSGGGGRERGLRKGRFKT